MICPSLIDIPHAPRSDTSRGSRDLIWIVVLYPACLNAAQAPRSENHCKLP